METGLEQAKTQAQAKLFHVLGLLGQLGGEEMQEWYKDEGIDTEDEREQEQGREERLEENLMYADISVRSAWTIPGEPLEPYEYEITLCTGGPAVKIAGELDLHNEPCSAHLEFQNWWTEWTRLPLMPYERQALLDYAKLLFYG